MSVTLGNIYKKKNGRFGFMVNAGVGPDGKPRRREVTAMRKNDLVVRRREIARQIATGTYTTGTTPTVGQWWTHWCEEIAAQRVRPNVLANYRSYGRRHVIPTIGARKLDALTADDVRHLHAVMRDGGASSRTVEAVHNTLSKCLKDAVREDKVALNICDKMDKPRAVSREREALSAAEVKALLTTIQGEPPMWRARWIMALQTGARQGECLGLEWDRVNLTPGMEAVDLSWQLQRVPWRHGQGCLCQRGVSAARCELREPDAREDFELRPAYLGLWLQRPKTAASIRVTPMTPALAAAMRDWKAETTGEGLVFTDGVGRPLVSGDDNAAWHELCARAGVRDVDLHSARHTMVSLMLESGVDPEIIRQIVGHSTLVSTRHYLHVSQDAARAALSVWGG
jgi:integrase